LFVFWFGFNNADCDGKQRMFRPAGRRLGLHSHLIASVSLRSAVGSIDISDNEPTALTRCDLRHRLENLTKNLRGDGKVRRTGPLFERIRARLRGFEPSVAGGVFAFVPELRCGQALAARIRFAAASRAAIYSGTNGGLLMSPGNWPLARGRANWESPRTSNMPPERLEGRDLHPTGADLFTADDHDPILRRSQDLILHRNRT
jgi:hypothetical protein